MIQFRVYAVCFTASAQAGAIDWFELVAPASCGIALFGLDIGQSTDFGDAAEEGIRWYVKRAAGSYTSGSGGNTGVARTPLRSGDAAATFSAETLNTTPIAAGSGTLLTLHQSVFNVRAGLDKLWTPETAPSCKASEALAIGMGAAPADSVTWEGTAYVAEIMG
ncbi:hypothetical protein [Spongiactinospora sp. TRM90649]|uniref:hypothetical protein n=1 Tax=Spongiactinospora sp. TRM90649 TaxID=3031114 RepID=UPI0023F765DC|nr:hypothetical protein [Spongiactinospora sp. TRM90649]MDF5758609.1 hypothetical protein [Spongiactinospora sp. TRM90649]